MHNRDIKVLNYGLANMQSTLGTIKKMEDLWYKKYNKFKIRPMYVKQCEVWKLKIENWEHET